MQGNRGGERLFEQALVGGGVVELQKVLMGCFKFPWVRVKANW